MHRRLGAAAAASVAAAASLQQRAGQRAIWGWMQGLLGNLIAGNLCLPPHGLDHRHVSAGWKGTWTQNSSLPSALPQQ